MKNILLIFGFLLLAGTISLALPCFNQLFAVSGCCKQRKSLTEGWAQTSLNYQQCEEENRRQDKGDDLLKPIGRIWWDIQCR